VIIWLDAQLSPQLAGWMEATFGIQCRHVRDLDLHDAEDPEIFKRASNSGVVVMTQVLS
jgi:predicted nuclease of predicted toxin-antitoxin system